MLLRDNDVTHRTIVDIVLQIARLLISGPNEDTKRRAPGVMIMLTSRRQFVALSLYIVGSALFIVFFNKRTGASFNPQAAGIPLLPPQMDAISLCCCCTGLAILRIGVVMSLWSLLKYFQVRRCTSTTTRCPHHCPVQFAFKRNMLRRGSVACSPRGQVNQLISPAPSTISTAPASLAGMEYMQQIEALAEQCRVSGLRSIVVPHNPYQMK